MSRLQTLLAQGASVEADGDGVVVRLSPDRRRKPALRLSREAFAAAAETVQVEDRWQTDEAGCNVKRSVNRAESPMAWLMRHKDRNGLAFLDRRHLAALEKLRDDHLTGYAQPGLTSNWQTYGTGGGHGGRSDDPHVFRLHARRRCEEALAQLGDLRAVFERVCLEGTALGVVERGFALPRRSAKHHVKAALDRLATYYGY